MICLKRMNWFPPMYNPFKTQAFRAIRAHSNVIKSTLCALLAVSIIAITWLLVWSESRTGFPNDDIVVYAMIAKLWGQGMIPYRDLADHKPPLIYSFFRLCFLFGGLSPKALYQGYTLLTGLVVLGFLFCGWMMSRFFLGILLGGFFAFFFVTDPLQLGGTAFLNTESLASIFLALALALLLAHRTKTSLWLVGAAGVAFGCAVMSKQPAILFGFPCFVQLLTTYVRPLNAQTIRKFLLASFVFCVGASVPILAYLIYFAAHHALYDLIFFTYKVNISYAGLNFILSPLRRNIFAEHMASLGNQLVHATMPMYLWGILALPALVIFRRSWLDLVSLSWILSALTCTALNVQGPHVHYHVFYQVPIALAAAILVEMVISVIPGHTIVRCTAALCALVFIFSSDASRVYARIQRTLAVGPTPKDSYDAIETRKFMSKLDALAGDNPRILFCGQNLQALFYTDLLPASKYIYDPPGVLPSELFKERLNSFKLYRPRVGLTRNCSQSEELNQYIRENYVSQEHDAENRSLFLK